MTPMPTTKGNLSFTSGVEKEHYIVLIQVLSMLVSFSVTSSTARAIRRGQTAAGILGSGKMVRRMVLVLTSVLTISDMRASGKMVEDMAKGCRSIATVTSIAVGGIMDCVVDQARIFLRMDLAMRAHGPMVDTTGQGCTTVAMDTERGNGTAAVS